MELGQRSESGGTRRWRTLVALVGVSLVSACYTGVEFEESWYGEGGEFGESSGSGLETETGGRADDTSSSGDDTTDTSSGDGDGDTTTTTGDGDGDTTTTTTGGGELPNNAYCDPVADWDPEWVAWELEVIELVNQARAQGGNCGGQGSFPPSGPLTWEPALTCAARVHSLDMADNDYFSHTNLEGNGPGWRLNQAGYNGGGWGENIAAGYGSPTQAVQGWLDSDGHCANMLNPGFSETGVGYAYGPGASYGHYWTQTFGG